MENAVEIIDKVYESTLISTSILVCASPAELGHMVTVLQGKCYPCVFASSSVDLRELSNKMIVTLAKEFKHVDFWEGMDGIRVDCVFFTSRTHLIDCISICTSQISNGLVMNIGS